MCRLACCFPVSFVCTFHGWVGVSIVCGLGGVPQPGGLGRGVRCWWALLDCRISHIKLKVFKLNHCLRVENLNV